MCDRSSATLECELLDKHRFKNQCEVALAVLDFIGGWHNPYPRHSAIGDVSPIAFEREHAA